MRADYTEMAPMRGGNASNVWKGIASGHMWATKGHAGVTSVKKAEAHLMTNGKVHFYGSKSVISNLFAAETAVDLKRHSGRTR